MPGFAPDKIETRCSRAAAAAREPLQRSQNREIRHRRGRPQGHERLQNSPWAGCPTNSARLRGMWPCGLCRSQASWAGHQYQAPSIRPVGWARVNGAVAQMQKLRQVWPKQGGVSPPLAGGAGGGGRKYLKIQHPPLTPPIAERGLTSGSIVRQPEYFFGQQPRKPYPPYVYRHKSWTRGPAPTHALLSSRA